MNAKDKHFSSFLISKGNRKHQIKDKSGKRVARKGRAQIIKAINSKVEPVK